MLLRHSHLNVQWCFYVRETKVCKVLFYFLNEFKLCSAFILPVFICFVLFASAHFKDLCRPCTCMPTSVCVCCMPLCFLCIFFLNFQMFTFFSFFFFFLFCFKLHQNKNSTANTPSSSISPVTQCCSPCFRVSCVFAWTKKQGHCCFCICYCSQSTNSLSVAVVIVITFLTFT